MKPTQFLLRLLNVRANEWNLVRWLFFFEFFQGAGMAFFFTASSALFLDAYGVEELPKVYIYSSFLLWIAGYIYSKLEAKLKITTLARAITFFMAGSCLLFRFGADIMPSSFLYLMFAWFNVLYLLNNLEFWGISSLLFDVRQSKRLFGIISAGDIPAKFIGYSLALILVSYIGTANLLIAGFISIIASLPMLKRIEESEGIRKHNLNHHHHNHSDHNHSQVPINHQKGLPQVKHAAYEVGHLVKNFTVNALIRRIAIVTVIASVVFIVANFAFYAKVKEAFYTDVGLAQFIAMFFAVVRVAAMIVKIIFTGRLINQLGTVKSLLLTPVLIILLVTSVLLLEYYSPGGNTILYLFGVMAIFVDVLRTSINTPVFLTLMQPLSTHERLRAHTITKGIMDPFAYLFTGVMVWIVINFEHSFHIETFNGILLLFCVLWIVGVYRINAQYLKTLLKTIGNRFFNNSEFSLSDSFTLHWLKQKFSNGNESEVSNIIKMITINNTMVADDIILSGLHHPSDKIKTQVLQMAEQRGIPQTEDILKAILNATSDPSLKAEAIKALCRTNIHEEEILPYINDENSMIQKAAITSLLKYGNLRGKMKALEFLDTMVNSESVNTRKKSAIVLQELQSRDYRLDILKLMDDGNAEVKQQAFTAAAKAGDNSLLKSILDKIHSDEKLVFEALYLAGENSLQVIHDFLASHSAGERLNEKFVRLIGRIGGAHSHKILMDLLVAAPPHPQIILKTLYQCNFKAGSHQRLFFEEQARHYINCSARILYMQKLLEPKKQRYHILSDSLELELVNLRDTLLYIFALIYDREQIKDVRMAFISGSKEAMANSMEIIEMTVKKESAFYFNIIFEPGDIEEKTYALRKLYPFSFFQNVENILNAILRQEDFTYDNWTTACSLYTSKKQHHTIDNYLISRYIEAEHPLLSEVARFAIYN